MVRSPFSLIPWMVATSLATSSALAGTTLYRTVDANGVVQYSDRPSPGAQPVSVNAAPPSAAGPAPPPGPAGQSAPLQRPPAPQLSCEITEPKPEQVYFDTQTVSVQLHAVPDLQQGLPTDLDFDGNGVHGSGTSFVLEPVYRGAHTVAATVHDAAGGVICRTPTVTFYVRDASVLTPARAGGQSAPAAPSAPLAPSVPHH